MEYPLLNFVDAALADKTNAKMIFEFYELDAGQVAVLLEQSGHGLEGYRRVLDSFAVRHIFKQHGNDKTESLRGQIGIVREDFLLIEKIVAYPEHFWIETNRIGHALLKYKLEFEGFRLVFAEEIRVGRRELAVQTLYKQKIRRQ
jgi:hypothetical protein